MGSAYLLTDVFAETRPSSEAALFCRLSICFLDFQTTPTVRLRSRLTFGSDRHFTQVTKGGVNTPLSTLNSLSYL